MPRPRAFSTFPACPTAQRSPQSCQEPHPASPEKVQGGGDPFPIPTGSQSHSEPLADTYLSTESPDKSPAFVIFTWKGLLAQGRPEAAPPAGRSPLGPVRPQAEEGR